MMGNGMFSFIMRSVSAEYVMAAGSGRSSINAVLDLINWERLAKIKSNVGTLSIRRSKWTFFLLDQ